MMLVWSYPNYLNLTRQKAGNMRFTESFKEIYRQFIRVVKQIRVLRVVHASAIHSAFQKAIKDYIQVLMLGVIVLIPVLNRVTEAQKNGLFIGLFYFIIYLLTSFASQKAHVFNVKSKQDASYSTLLYGFGFGLISGIFYRFDMGVFALVFFIGIYLIENLRKPILTGLLADEVPDTVLASVISVQSLWKTLMTALLALMLGFLADRWNVGLALITVSALLLLLTFVIHIRSVKRV